MESLSVIFTYKNFKVIPVTEKVKKKYSIYSCSAAYIIVNPKDEYEWETDNLIEARDWISCYQEAGNMLNKLMKKVEYAKASLIPRQALYQVYGQIEMALELNAITENEYFLLNTACVRNGINNPRYFER